jgi:hypothetical protein
MSRCGDLTKPTLLGLHNHPDPGSNTLVDQLYLPVSCYIRRYGASPTERKKLRGHVEVVGAAGGMSTRTPRCLSSTLDSRALNSLGQTRWTRRHTVLILTCTPLRVATVRARRKSHCSLQMLRFRSHHTLELLPLSPTTTTAASAFRTFQKMSDSASPYCTRITYSYCRCC